MNNPPLRVAAIGLGAMGAPIARRMLDLQLPLIVWNRDLAKTEEFRAKGAAVARSPKEAAASADVVISVVFDDAALESVATGEDGIAAGLRPGAIHLSCSTISSALADRLDHLHAGLGQHLVCAPLLGSAAMAASGTLYLAASGPPEPIERLEPIFSIMAQKTVVVGSRGRDAIVAKLANNFLLFALTEALAEAQALAEKAGLSRAALMEMLWDTDFAKRVFAVYGRKVLERAFVPATAPARLAVKDMRLALDEAAETGTSMPMAQLAAQRLDGVVDAGWGELEFAALSLLIDRESGLALPGS